MWEEVLQKSPIDPQSNFFELGGDSLLAAILLTQIEIKFNKKVSLNALFQAPTVAQLAALLRSGHSLKPSRAAAIQAAGSRPPFFCVSAGPLFRNLAKRLGTDQPFLTLLLEEFSRARCRLEEIAAHHVETIRKTQPQGPYFLGGWSDAGVVAYEVAQQLQQEGRHVALLVLFDSENPANDRDVSTFRSLVERSDVLRQWFQIKWRLLRNSGRKEAVRRVRDSLTYRSDRLKETIRRSARRIQHRSKPEEILADALAKYKPQAYTGNLVLFQRSDRPVGLPYDPLFGWGKLVSKLEIHEIPGDHRDMFLEPKVQLLAEKLNACLLRAQEL